MTRTSPYIPARRTPKKTENHIVRHGQDKKLALNVQAHNAMFKAATAYHFTSGVDTENHPPEAAEILSEQLALVVDATTRVAPGCKEFRAAPYQPPVWTNPNVDWEPDRPLGARAYLAGPPFEVPELGGFGAAFATNGLPYRQGANLKPRNLAGRGALVIARGPPERLDATQDLTKLIAELYTLDWFGFFYHDVRHAHPSAPARAMVCWELPFEAHDLLAQKNMAEATAAFLDRIPATIGDTGAPSETTVNNSSASL